MKTSAEKLKEYIQKEYIDNPGMGSPDMYSAIRDLMVDVYHLCKEEDLYVNLSDVVSDAQEVFWEEDAQEV